MSTQKTDSIYSISLADLPRYADLLAEFQSLQQDPDAKPLSMMQKLKLFAKNFGSRLIDRINGIDSPSEYHTGRVYIPTFHGEKYQTMHIKDGQAVSETITSITATRSGEGIRKNEIKSTMPLIANGFKKVLSRHSFMTLDGTKDQVVTEGITKPNGVSYVRTQNFETGETVFRKNDKGLFFTWTFDRNKRLISAYEGRFGMMNGFDYMRQTDYQYTPKGQLISATETRHTITPTGEKVETVHLPIASKKQKTIFNIGGRE